MLFANGVICRNQPRRRTVGVPDHSLGDLTTGALGNSQGWPLSLRNQGVYRAAVRCVAYVLKFQQFENQLLRSLAKNL